MGMQTIQVVIDANLLAAADAQAKRSKLNRSALVRDALRMYLQHAEVQEKERLERLGYERTPDRPAEVAAWERVAAWPET